MTQRLLLARRATVATLALLVAACGSPVLAQSVALGAEDDAAPWSYADGSGYVNDIVRAAFGHAGWSVQIEVMPFDPLAFVDTACRLVEQSRCLGGGHLVATTT